MVELESFTYYPLRPVAGNEGGRSALMLAVAPIAAVLHVNRNCERLLYKILELKWVTAVTATYKFENIYV